MDYGLASRTALQIVQQELATKKVEQWVRSELENTDLREKLDILGRSTKEEDNQKPRKRGLKLNVISGKTFGMTREGTKITSIKSVTGHQVVKNLSEFEITLVHLDIYAGYLREKYPKMDSRQKRALLTTGGPRLMKVDGHHIEVHGPYLILMNVRRCKILHDAGFGLCVLAGASQKTELREDKLCVRTGALPVEKNAIWTMQCDGYVLTINGSGTHDCD